MKTSAAALVMLMALTGAAEAAQFVVLEARGISLARGTMLDSSKPLVLKQGQHVTLISDSGVTLKLDGPYNKPPSAVGGKGVDLSTALKGLVTEREARLTEVGTTRGTAAVAKLPSPWLLDASRGGNRCLLEGQAPVFWRPTSDRAISFAIMPADRSWKVETSWPAGVDRMALNLPYIKGDQSYLLAYGASENAVTIDILPSALQNDKMRAAWMAAKGCEAQAEALAQAGK
jgi:hypothetical protein